MIPLIFTLKPSALVFSGSLLIKRMSYEEHDADYSGGDEEDEGNSRVLVEGLPQSALSLNKIMSCLA